MFHAVKWPYERRKDERRKDERRKEERRIEECRIEERREDERRDERREENVRNGCYGRSISPVKSKSRWSHLQKIANYKMRMKTVASPLQTTVLNQSGWNFNWK